MSVENAGSWSGPKIVGTGWANFKHIFSGGEGIIYAITPDGILKWYKTFWIPNGEATWKGPIDVGTGWNNFSKAFSSGMHDTGGPASDGVIIYVVTEDTLFLSRLNEGHTANIHSPGKLLWYKHHGYQNGTKDGDGPKTVGSGWDNFENIFASLPGVVEVR